MMAQCLYSIKDQVIEFYTGTEKEDKVRKMFQLVDQAEFPKDKTKKVQMKSPVCGICFSKENLQQEIKDVYEKKFKETEN